MPIYYAREEDDGTMSSKILAERITEAGTDADSFYDFASAESYIETLLPSMNDKDVVITMGAGEAFMIGDNLLINNG